MEEKVKLMFDYQRFEPNENLEKVIRGVKADTVRELDPDELEFVNAAGAIYDADDPHGSEEP